jgi:ferredoxin
VGVKLKFEKGSLCQEVPVGADFQRIHVLYPDLPLRFGCRNAECGVCVIYVTQGIENLTKMTPEEIKTLERKGLPKGCRLACQCALNGDVTVGTLPPSE